MRRIGLADLVGVALALATSAVVEWGISRMRRREVNHVG